MAVGGADRDKSAKRPARKRETGMRPAGGDSHRTSPRPCGARRRRGPPSPAAVEGPVHVHIIGRGRGMHTCEIGEGLRGVL